MYLLYSLLLTVPPVALGDVLFGFGPVLNSGQAIRFFVFVVATRLLIGCAIPFIVGLFKLLRSETLIAAAASLAVFSVGVATLWSGSLPYLPSIAPFDVNIWTAATLGVAAAMTALLFYAQIGPFFETDSVLSFQFIRDWLDHKQSTLEFAFNYSSFWESNLAAGFVFLKSGAPIRGHLLVSQLEPIVLMVLVTVDLCNQLELPGFLIALVVFNGLALNIIWSWPSGIGALKNDGFYNAGLALFIDGVAQMLIGHDSVGTQFQIGCAVIFASAKYSGFIVLPLLGVFSMLVAMITLKTTFVLPFVAKLIVPCLIASPAALLFLVRNSIRLGNPLHPVKLSVLGFHLPGHLDPKGTTLFDAVRSKTMWRLLLGRHDFSGSQAWPSGLLIFAGLIVSPVIACWVLSIAGSSGRSPSSNLIVAAFVAFAAIAMLFIWSITVWSASSRANNLQFMRQLWSLRYVSFLPTLSVLALMSVVPVVSTPAVLLVAAILLLVDTGLRFQASKWTLVRLPLRDVLEVALATFCVAGLLIWAATLGFSPSACFMVFLVGCLILQQYCDGVFLLRYHGPPHYRFLAGVRDEIDRYAAADVYVVIRMPYDGTELDIGTSEYFVSGDRLQHRIARGTLTDLAVVCAKGLQPQFAMASFWRYKAPSDASLDEMRRLGWHLGYDHVVVTPQYFLFTKNKESLNLSATSVAAPRVDRRPVEIPGKVQLGQGAGRFLSDAEGPIEPGKKYFAIGVPSVNAIVSEGSFASLLPELRLTRPLEIAMKPGGRWNILSGADVDISVNTSSLGSSLQLTASDLCRWMGAIIYTGEFGRGRPITIVAKVRSVGESKVIAGFWDIDPAGARPEGLHRSTSPMVVSEWTWICLSHTFSGQTGAERFIVGAVDCPIGAGVEIESADVLDGAISIIDKAAVP